MATHEILIVDSDKEEVERTSRMLQELGYKTLSADDIESAQAVLRARDVAAVLCDYILSSGTGIDLLKMVREQDHMKNLPVLIMTTAASSKVVSEAREYGVSDFLLRPMSSNRLRRGLAQFISKDTKIM